MGYYSLSDGSCQSEVLTAITVHITWFIDPACVAMPPSAVNVNRQERVGEQRSCRYRLGRQSKWQAGISSKEAGLNVIAQNGGVAFVSGWDRLGGSCLRRR